MRAALGTSCLLAVWLAAAAVQAQAEVTALDGRSWAEVVSDWVESTASQGSAVSLCVHAAADRCVPCGGYALELDPALAIGACDPASGATSVLLVDRASLFDHAGAIPAPRPVTVRATLPSGTVVESVAPRAAGTGIGCSVGVRPYLRDLEHGTIVMLGADAYDVVVARMRAIALPSADGSFVISSTDATQSSVAYDVVERATGRVVLVGRASLSCSAVADVPATAEGAVAPIPSSPARALVTPVVPVGTGIRTRPHPPSRDVASGLAIAAGALGGASALTLVALGIAEALQTARPCTAFGAPIPRAGGATGSAGAPARDCIAWGPPGVSHTPAALTWTMVGGLGAGLVLGIAAVVVGQAASDDELQLALDVGPDGARVGVGVRF